jgi:hypothetical protein
MNNIHDENKVHRNKAKVPEYINKCFLIVTGRWDVHLLFMWKRVLWLNTEKNTQYKLLVWLVIFQSHLVDKRPTRCNCKFY